MTVMPASIGPRVEVQISIRRDQDDRLRAFSKRLSEKQGKRVSRAAIIRRALDIGLDDLEEEMSDNGLPK